MKGESVCVFYPFHPLHGQQLQVFVTARSQNGAVTVEDQHQNRLRIPLWMLTPDAARFELQDTPTLDARALLRLVELWQLHCDKLPGWEVHPQKESSHETTLAVQAATSRHIGPGC
ncbi:MAG: hypothetical protein WB990_08895 [Candidatus Acidiferrales bacterium]